MIDAGGTWQRYDSNNTIPTTTHPIPTLYYHLYPFVYIIYHLPYLTSLTRSQAAIQNPLEGPRGGSKKIPDPPMFDGTREKLDPFIFKLQGKLKANADWWENEATRIQYAFNRLEGRAEKQILPRMDSNNSACIEDMDGFYEALRTAFGDPDKKWTAQQTISKLKQANKPFHEYLSQFQAHIGDAGFDQDDIPPYHTIPDSAGQASLSSYGYTPQWKWWLSRTIRDRCSLS